MFFLKHGVYANYYITAHRAGTNFTVVMWIPQCIKMIYKFVVCLL